MEKPSQHFYNFGDESLNWRNPSALRRQPFQIRYYGGSISASDRQEVFLLPDFQRRRIDDNAIINATGSRLLNRFLPPGVPVPNENFSLSPRFDYQLGTNHTLVLRYSYSRFKAQNLGASTFVAARLIAPPPNRSPGY
jgi:hypothetical protein